MPLLSAIFALDLVYGQWYSELCLLYQVLEIYSTTLYLKKWLGKFPALFFLCGEGHQPLTAGARL